MSTDAVGLQSAKCEQGVRGDCVWINPIGGLGDMLMLSGVLKLVADSNPDVQFNLVRRTRYTHVLQGHPAIQQIGSPPRGATIVGTDYWAKEQPGEGNQRAFQILARMFNLATPVTEKLFFPGSLDKPDLLHNLIPWGSKPIVLLAPNSDSPRKMMHPMAWHLVVERLLDDGTFVVQTGLAGDQHIRNTYSLLGLTTPRELVSLAKKSSVILTVDNFLMHVGHLVGTPTVVVWGPTDSRVYGYPEQIHLEATLEHCSMKDECLGPSNPQNYSTPCPLNERHCMNTISNDTIVDAIHQALDTQRLSRSESTD